MQLTCPTCHVHMPLESALQDEAGRELLGMLSGMPRELVLPLVHYLAFFRPAKQQLGWGRSLRLAREVLELGSGDALLLGLVEAGRGLDEKRAQAGWRPLGNHNYLRRVMEAAEARIAASPGHPHIAADGTQPRAPKSKAGGALVALEGLKR
jgi:hypothetical protein